MSNSVNPPNNEIPFNARARRRGRGGEDQAKIVATDTEQMVLDLSEQGLPGHVLWAPDSKRFAFNWGRGPTHQTALYQLRDDHWVALKFPGDGDEIQKQADDIVAGQLKKEGLS